jgi:hypothetical protein
LYYFSNNGEVCILYANLYTYWWVFLIPCMAEVGGLGVTLDHLRRGRDKEFSKT